MENLRTVTFVTGRQCGKYRANEQFASRAALVGLPGLHRVEIVVLHAQAAQLRAQGRS